MFSPRHDQTILHQKATDIQELRFRYEDYVRKTNIKIQMLENESAIHKHEISLLNNSNKVRADEVSDLKAKIAACMGDIASQRQRFSDLEGQFNSVINKRLDLAGKIADAKKRLEKQDIAPKKVKVTK